MKTNIPHWRPRVTFYRPQVIDVLKALPAKKRRLFVETSISSFLKTSTGLALFETMLAEEGINPKEYIQDMAKANPARKTKKKSTVSKKLNSKDWAGEFSEDF